MCVCIQVYSRQWTASLLMLFHLVEELCCCFGSVFFGCIFLNLSRYSETSDPRKEFYLCIKLKQFLELWFCSYYGFNPMDLSTHQFAEMVAGTSRSLDTETVLKTWYGIGSVVKDQMTNNKGVRLEKFGSFSFNKCGEPIFNVSSEFSSKFRVNQKSTPPLDNITVSKLNLTQLRNITGLDRASSENIYNQFITAVGKSVQVGRKALLKINKVCEISFSNNSLSVTFIPDFLTAIGVDDRTGPDKELVDLEKARTAAKKAVKAG